MKKIDCKNMDNKLVSAAMRARIELIETSFKDTLKQKDIEINELKLRESKPKVFDFDNDEVPVDEPQWHDTFARRTSITVMSISALSKT